MEHDVWPKRVDENKHASKVNYLLRKQTSNINKSKNKQKTNKNNWGENKTNSIKLIYIQEIISEIYIQTSFSLDV